MQTAIVIISFFILLSKFLDCYTTAVRITSVYDETNPIARRMMQKFGIQTTIWSIYSIYVGIIGLSNWLLITRLDTTLSKVLFILVGVVLTSVQFAVAHTNHTRRANRISKLLYKIFLK